MLTVKKLKEVLANLGDDMEVVMEFEEGQAESINSLGKANVGVRNWSGLIDASLPLVNSQEVLMLSRHEP